MKKAALEYHSKLPAGKLSTEPTKSCRTQRDLSLAYTPGVAEPALAIAQDSANVYKYTNKGNLVGVISNGTAVLGLGDVGPAASKPVMEGKCVLFKRFAGLDAFDLEISSRDADQIIASVAALEPTFGAINLEDFSAPDCFYIEDQLRKKMDIPVFHDDQHGTAIISGAALLNALEVVGKKISEVKIVVNGAGAAGIRCAEHYIRLGASKKNLYLVDSKGVLNKERTNLSTQKKKFVRACVERTLDEVVVNADVFLGVSVKDVLTPEMLLTMAVNPIVFALANPDPEISYSLAQQTRRDILVATGRSDFPNQINNVLGFPFILRGALDVRATDITDNMKVAATKALAELAQRSVPQHVLKAYRLKRLSFGPDYIVPKPFDQRVLVEVSAAVAKAAITDGVAKIKITDKSYKNNLSKLANSLNKHYGYNI